MDHLGNMNAATSAPNISSTTGRTLNVTSMLGMMYGISFRGFARTGLPVPLARRTQLRSGSFPGGCTAIGFDPGIPLTPTTINTAGLAGLALLCLFSLAFLALAAAGRALALPLAGAGATCDRTVAPRSPLRPDRNFATNHLMRLVARSAFSADNSAVGP